MGGSRRQTTSSSQTTELPQNQQANVDLLMQGAQDLYRSGGPQFFPGQNYTSPTPLQEQGRAQAVNYAQGAGQSAVNSATQGNQFWTDPSRVFDLQSVPGYGAVRSGIQDTVTRNLTENVLPENRLGGVASGGLGGSRAGMMDALAMGRTSEALASSLGQLDLGVAGMNQQAHQAALGRAPQMYQMGLDPARTVEAVGSAQRGDQAEQLAGDRERHDFEQNMPAMLLGLLQQFTGSAGQYGGTNTTEQTTAGGGGGIGQILGPLLMVASMFTGGATAPLGAALMAGGGAATAAGNRGIGPF